MSQNSAAGIEEALDIDADADDDDDIVDLLEVVKPGTLPLPDGVFPDPTPVDHIVDYNESLDLPGMDDLDAFLSSLGVTPESDSPAPSGDAPPVSDPDLEALDAVPAVDAAPVGNHEPMDENFLDSLLAEEENDDTAESVPAPEESDAPDPPAESGLDEDFLTDAPRFAADRQTMMADEPESGVHGHASGMPGVTANHGFAAVSVSEASASLTPEELDLLQEGMPMDQELEFDGDASLDAAFTEALDAAMAAEGDSVASARDVPFGAVRDAAFEALMKGGDVVGDQTPSAPGSPEEVFEAVFDAEEKEPPDETAARNAEAAKDTEEPLGTLFPEPVLEDAPQSGAVPAAAATVPPGSASRFDEVDLNELDALLDTMLASAPPPDPVPDARPGEEAPAVAGAPAPTGEPSAADNGGASVKLESDLAALRLDVENLRGALAVLPDQAARLAKIEERLPVPEEPGTDEEASGDPGFADSLQCLEDRILTLESRLEEAFTRDAQAQASLDALGERIAGLAAGLEGIERRFADFSANIDKVAAKAAATVLREEIAALAEQDD